MDNHEILNKNSDMFNSRGTNYRWSKGAHDNHIEHIVLLRSGRGPSDKEVDHISNTVRTIKSQHPATKNLCMFRINE